MTNRNPEEETPLQVLQQENAELRKRIESFEQQIASVAPELEGMTLGGKIKSLKEKNLRLVKDNLRYSVLVRHVRKLLVSSILEEETEENLTMAKKLLDDELFRK